METRFVIGNKDYFVSEDGRVFKTKDSSEVVPTLSGSRYVVNLYKDKVRKTHSLSTLIYKAFNPEFNGRAYRIDLSKKGSLKNLTTRPSKQTKKALSVGFRKAKAYPIEVRVKLTNELVGRYMGQALCIEELNKLGYNLSQPLVSMAIRGRTRSHRGLTFSVMRENDYLTKKKGTLKNV